MSKGTCKGGSMSASLNPFSVALRSTLMEMYLKFVPRKESGEYKYGKANQSFVNLWEGW